MKTLDTVIDYAHMIVPMIGESDTKEMWRSIEYYLTAHKKIQPVIEKIALGRIEDVIDTIDNSPLTWDELNCMNDKPVWVEVDGKWWGRFWAFVEVGNDSYINFFQKGQEDPEDLWKRDMGKTWNAFRKERK